MLNSAGTVPRAVGQRGNCRRILRHCHDALPACGALLISESVRQDGLGTVFGTLMFQLIARKKGARK